MIQTMCENNGIGLAANQVGYNRRIFVMDTSNERDNPQIFINPVIKVKQKKTSISLSIIFNFILKNSLLW